MTTGRFTTFVMKSRTYSLQSSGVYWAEAFSLLPYPGRVGQYTLYPLLQSSSMLSLKCAPIAPNPWQKRTTFSSLPSASFDDDDDDDDGEDGRASMKVWWVPRQSQDLWTAAVPLRSRLSLAREYCIMLFAKSCCSAAAEHALAPTVAPSTTPFTKEVQGSACISALHSSAILYSIPGETTPRLRCFRNKTLKLCPKPPGTSHRLAMASRSATFPFPFSFFPKARM
mmetsp:Transcript_35001/g.75803  ORF Transcript_35001/g.75803 Transcript_35001/m.75803 type:complete len:226 (+) Transcript_35001:739-1416(+)